MTNTEKIAFKNRLKQVALDLVQQRILTSRMAIDNAQQAANSEEKSSAGDKYETARAMGHLEKDMHARQLAEHLKELANVQAVMVDRLYDAAVTGAFVQTEQTAFFIATGLGKQLVDGIPVLYLSPRAPLAQQLLHKKAGDRLQLQAVNVLLVEVF